MFSESSKRKRKKKRLIFKKTNYLFILGCARSLLLCPGFLSSCCELGLLCRGAWASHCGGFSCCRARALNAWASVAAVCRLSNRGAQALASLRHVESSCTRDRIHVPCIGRQIPIHCTTKEVPELKIFLNVINVT